MHSIMFLDNMTHKPSPAFKKNNDASPGTNDSQKGKMLFKRKIRAWTLFQETCKPGKVYTPEDMILKARRYKNYETAKKDWVKWQSRASM